jgi:hypothetical protein
MERRSLGPCCPLALHRQPPPFQEGNADKAASSVMVIV